MPKQKERSLRLQFNAPKIGQKKITDITRLNIVMVFEFKSKARAQVSRRGLFFWRVDRRVRVRDVNDIWPGRQPASAAVREF